MTYSEEREKMIDAAFRTFKEIFGYYPRVAGCWSIDSFSLAYIEKTYGLAAFCICKEQFGTDGITVWGGPYTGGYYPSKNNAVMPARAKENQIGIPVLRMLGPDIFDQYDLGLGSPEERQAVCSLEPVYAEGGGDPRWVDWFLRETYNGKALSLAYAQFGQENSFGWADISKGLPMQFQKLKAKADSGDIVVETLGETGLRFKKMYALTPPGCSIADTDAENTGRKTAWYASRFYRVNFLFEGGRAWIRDFQLYSDAYAEPYLHKENTDTRCGTFALPVTDGFRFSANGVRAGIYVNAPECGACVMETAGEDTVTVRWGGVTFTAAEKTLTVHSNDPDFYLRFRYAPVPALPYEKVTATTLHMTFRDFTGMPFSYALRLSAGRFSETADGIEVLPDETGNIKFLCEA